MRTLIPAGYAMLELVYELTGVGRRMTTSLGFSVNAAPTQAQVDTLMAGVVTRMKPGAPSQYVIKDSRVYVGDGTNNPPFLTHVTSTPGTSISANLVPQAVCTVIEKRTALSGKKGKGRMYIPGLREDAVGNAGFLIAGHITFWNTTMADLKTFIEGTSWVGDLYLLGHASGPAPRQITSLICRFKVGTQVNRLRETVP